MKQFSTLLGFLPWILFFIFCGNSITSIEIATILALISHIWVNHRTIKKWFILDVGTLIFFVLFAFNVFFLKYSFITNNGYLLSNLVLALIAWISLIIGKPFTLQYANLTVPLEIKQSKLYISVNYILTFIWAFLITMMLLPNIVEFFITLKYATEVNMAVSIILVVMGVVATDKFPDWFIDKAHKKKFDIDIKKIFKLKRSRVIDFTNFNDTNIANTCDASTDVLIVGAGPIGLASALLLKQFGINSIIVEKHPSTSIHPKARGISCRSMELLRKLGIEEEIKKYDLPRSQNWMGWFSSLTGEIYTKIVKKTDYKTISPTDEANVPQTILEKIMLQKLQDAGGTVLFQHKVIDFSQNIDIVKLQTTNVKTGEIKVFQAKYLIAADGAHSKIRQLLKIPMIGPNEINAVLSVYCEINLEDILSEEQRFNLAFILNPTGASPMVLSMSERNKWVFVFPSAGVALKSLKEIYTDEYIKTKIYSIIGCSENVEIKIISTNAWSLGSQIANQIIAGRTFLLGDSAHRFAPTGGMGMNTGLQDVDNLMWKLAFVLRSFTDSSVLETYATERIPSILDNMEWSLSNLKKIIRLQKGVADNGVDNTDFTVFAKEQEAHLNKSGLDLGLIYSSNIIMQISKSKPQIPYDQYISNIYPGARLPHFEIIYDGKVTSTLDLISTDFMFLCLEQGQKYIMNINFKSLPTKMVYVNEVSSIQNDINVKLVDLLGQFGQFAACWVRPDGHIAWVGSLDLTDDLKKLREIIDLMAV